IDVEVDDTNQRVIGSETITYTNHSPDPLSYLWIQLDENEHKADAENKKFDGSSIGEQMTTQQLQALIGGDKGLGVDIQKVADGSGKPLAYTINHTMMRVELPTALKPGGKFVLQIDWQYNISDRMEEGG